MERQKPYRISEFANERRPAAEMPAKRKSRPSGGGSRKNSNENRGKYSRNDSVAQARCDWEAAIKLARDAEDYWVLDRERRSLATVLALPNVVVYVVQPGAVAGTMRDPQIELLFAVGQPIVFAFMRREDAIEMRDYGRRAKLAATPTAAMGRA